VTKAEFAEMHILWEEVHAKLHSVATLRMRYLSDTPEDEARSKEAAALIEDFLAAVEDGPGLA
jgi:hypothetical protein